MVLAEKEDIESFAQKLRDLFEDQIEEIMLYGSYATDDHVPGSDIDIMVLVSDKEEIDEKKIWDLVEEEKIEKDLHFTPKIYEKEEFEEKVEKDYSFFTEVNKLGVKV